MTIEMLTAILNDEESVWGRKKKKRFADGSLRALITCNVFRVVHKEDEKKNHRGSVYGVKGAVKLSVFFFHYSLSPPS